MKYSVEYLKIVDDILKNNCVKNLRQYKHHYSYTRLEHSLSVSYYSYIICKFLHLDYISVARAGLLHDLFFYDCENKTTRPKNHIKTHPKISLENAKKLFILNDKEQDIILKHMWPVTTKMPKYKESFIVTFVDKYCALKEWSIYCAFKTQLCFLFLVLQYLNFYHLQYL